MLSVPPALLYVSAHTHVCTSVTCDDYDRYDFQMEDNYAKDSRKRQCLQRASTDLFDWGVPERAPH